MIDVTIARVQQGPSKDKAEDYSLALVESICSESKCHHRWRMCVFVCVHWHCGSIMCACVCVCAGMQVISKFVLSHIDTRGTFLETQHACLHRSSTVYTYT